MQDILIVICDNINIFRSMFISSHIINLLEISFPINIFFYDKIEYYRYLSLDYN